MVTVLYFAACRERVGLERETVDLAGLRVSEAVDVLVARHPKLAELASLCRVAVNAAFASTDAVVPDGAEVALIPPVAGG